MLNTKNLNVDSTDNINSSNILEAFPGMTKKKSGGALGGEHTRSSA